MKTDRSTTWLGLRGDLGQWAREFGREEEGSSLVEMVLSLVVLLTCVFGIADCSRLLYIDHFVAGAGREAARYAIVRGSSWTGTTCSTATQVSCTVSNAGVQRYVASIVPGGVRASLLSVTTTWPGTTASGSTCTLAGASNDPGCVVAVKVGYQFNFVTPFLHTGSVTLASTSKMTILR